MTDQHNAAESSDAPKALDDIHRQWDKRLQDVYWHGALACRARGPDKAECALLPDHDGSHEGNGFDVYGPKPWTWRNDRRPWKPDKRRRQYDGTTEA